MPALPQKPQPPSPSRRQWLRRCGLVVLGASGAAQAQAQTPGQTPGQGSFPQRPISLVVPFGPGGIADLTARAVAQAMAVSLGQAVVVENKPSAGSIVASQAVMQAAPDGHTLLLMSNGHAVAPSLMRKLPYDAQKDFAPIATLASFDLAVFVAQGSRFKTLGDLMAEARTQPGKLSVGSIAVGSTQHLAAAWFKQASGLDLLQVPYKATPAVLTALRAGEIDVAFEILGPWLPQVQAGALRVLAVSSGQRFADLPDVPTVQQAGGAALAGYDLASWNALAAPAGTPPAVLVRLNSAANDALRQPAVLQQLKTLGVRPRGGTPDELRQLLATETRHWAEVVRRAGITAQ